jgi:hypothetical protein
MRGQCHAPATFYPRERPCTHCTGGWVGPRAGLDRCGKSHLPPDFHTWTIQHVAIRYTDYATWPTLHYVAYPNFPNVFPTNTSPIFTTPCIKTCSVLLDILVGIKKIKSDKNNLIPCHKCTGIGGRYSRTLSLTSIIDVVIINTTLQPLYSR